MPTEKDRAGTFDDTDVARCYAYRPPYAPALYEFLREIAPGKKCLLDLGCGPGKVAAALADDFTKVVAVDPAGAMIETARALHAARHPNIAWMHARAEDVALDDAIDLVTAGTSIHWMQHDVLFPRLAERSGLVAVITGDAPRDPPWRAEWRGAMTKWLKRLHGKTYDEAAFAADGQRFEAWLDIAGRKRFAFSFRQSVEDFIACQHARASWARMRMGDALVAEFDRELDALLRPWAQDGILTLPMVSELTWGVPRRAREPEA